MNVIKKVANKIENSKIVKNPKFLIIGLIIIIAIITLIYFIFLKYSPIMNFKYEGYAISGKEITENLLGSSDSNNSEAGASASKNLELAKIEEQGTIFKKLNEYFVGNKEKTEINLNYPIYINNNSIIYNLAEDTTLISKEFEQIAGYPNLSISEGKIYDGNNLERADGKEYIFVKTSDNIFINLYEIKITTTANEYTIPVNSIIAFTENAIRYYTVNNNVLVFNEITDIDNNSNVEIVENSYTYEELLTRLGILADENNTDSEQEEQSNIIQEDSTAENDSVNKNDNKEVTDENTTTNDNEQGQASYIKPQVTVEDFRAEVYTAKSILHINDPTGRIIEAPTFEIYKDGKMYLRRIFSNSGEIQITGLVPETEYEVTGKFIYLNENNQKVENTFYEGRFTTKGYDQLGSIDITKENGEIYSNKIQITKVKITSDLNAEAIKGVNEVEIETGEIRTVLKNSQVNELLQGKEITIESSEGLESDSKINYVIRFYDKNGIELKVNNNKGETRTSKEAPTVRVTIKEQDIVSVTLGLKLTNRDNVELENYKYVVTRPNGEVVQEKRLSENESELLLEDLDQNQYYRIGIYADYDLNDNRGKQEQVEIGNLVFATQPISTLGSLELTVENKELTSTTSTISYKIDEERTDKRLIQILNELTINIVERPANSNDNEEDNIKTTVVYTDTLSGDEITNLQQAGIKEIKYENLKSNTTYTIEIAGNVQLGNTKEEIPITYNYKEFITLKIPAKVEIKNQFVTGNLIDFDVRIEDINNSVLSNTVRMELRDADNNLIDLQEITTNQDYIRKTYEKLEENQTYKLSFYADQYNEGSTDETYKVNYLITELEIVTEPGISGEIGLTELTRKATGKNLVDVNSKVKWYADGFNRTVYGKEYNQEENSLKLYAGKTSSQSQQYLYDLSEYIGEQVTISFEARIEGTPATIRLINGNLNSGYTELKNNISKEWTSYEQTLTVAKEGYVGFFVQASSSSEDVNLYIKDLQIELGARKTAYEPYKYNLNSSLNINLEDKRNEITTNDYYLKIYEDDTLIKTDRYEEIPENNIIENIEKEYEVNPDKTYKVELVIKIKDREYILDLLEFNTNNSEEIKGIYNLEDYQKIQPEGKYIVLNDLNLINFARTYQVDFNGSIDFNGHIITPRYGYGMFHDIGAKGIIENIVLDIRLSESAAIQYEQGYLFRYNYGTIRNIQLNLLESYNVANRELHLLGGGNLGTIENFVFYLQQKLYGSVGLSIGVEQNNGTIRNGYIYGEGIEQTYLYTSTSVSNIAGIANKNRGIIENIYTNFEITRPIQINKDNYAGNIVVTNNGSVNNVYSISSGDLVKGPNVGILSGGIVTNSYYFSDEVIKNSTETMSTKLALYDTEFQNQLLNSKNAFDIENTVNNGYFPHVIMSDCMSTQPFINLPEVQDKDLVDILSTTVLENNNDNVKVEFSVNNPSGEDIQNIEIKNMTTTILNQEYNEGKTKVTALLSNPVMYVSNYSVLSITSKGAYNIPYTREFEDGERNIQVDFYRTIYTVDDWEQINKSPTENYKLMNDLDFINETNNIYVSNTFTGKLDGNNHEIKNIKLEKPLITNCKNGKIENLFIRNVKLIKNSNVSILGVIGTITQGTINNVHIKNINATIQNEQNLNGNIKIAVLAGYSNGGAVTNSSVSDMTLENNKEFSSLCLGGLIGESSATRISNSFTQNITFSIEKVNDLNIGAFTGKEANEAGEIKNCYAVGDIKVDKGNVGGITGYSYGRISDSYSLVNIETMSDNAGGIVGYDMSNYNNISQISNNIAIGNIYTSKTSDFVGRIVGRKIKDNFNNYFYEYQRLNGETTNEGSYIVKKSDLSKSNVYINLLNWTEEYDYENYEKGRLPLLTNNLNGNIIPNQQENYLPELAKLDISSIETDKISSDTIQIRLEISNPDNVEIVNVEIENMDVNIRSIQNDAKNTYIYLTAKANKFFDVYKISKIVYLENGEEKSENLEKQIKITLYKEIYSFEDWQNIEGEYQNYKLMSDIDFTGKTNINSELLIGRLESEGGKYKLSNINIEENNITSLIREVQTEIKNISFENIVIKNTTSSTMSNLGIILYNFGIIDNVSFKNIEIDAEHYGTVGCIANNQGEGISNINLELIKINARDTIGGLVGNLFIKVLENITGNHIEINASNNFVGGLFGQITNDDIYKDRTIENVNVNDIEIKGNSYIGGIIGTGSGLRNMTVTNAQIEGNSYVGGIAGNSGFINNSRNNKIINSTIKGNGSYIGGISGSYGGGNNNIVDGCIIETTSNSKIVGGAFGSQVNGCGSVVVINTKIKSDGQGVGGIIGAMSNGAIHESYVQNVEIVGVSNIGGIAGEGNLNYSIYATYNNVKINATGSGIGGIIGYLNNEYTSATNNSNFFKNAVYNAKLHGESAVGGIIGKTYKELYTGQNSNLSSNYVQAELESVDDNTVSLGIGDRQDQNQYLIDTYYYKYSTINGENPNELNNAFISEDQYLIEEELKQKTTYTSKLKWTSNWNFEKLSINKYPILGSGVSAEQEGIDIPIDAEHIVSDENTLNTQIQNLNNTNQEDIEQTFEYVNKEIETYSTYSVITAEDGSQVTRNTKLYVKDNNLYAVPATLSGATAAEENVTPVANNFILDSYNGKEYETVLGSDGRMYDLKEPITYPENFVNENIESIGNNLNSDSHEVEVIYQNGDKVKFNYQTGEIISSSESNNSDGIGLFEYITDKISEIGNSGSNVTEEISNKYEASKELQTKLEETSVEEAIEKNVGNSTQQAENIGIATENNATNNSYKENKYISIYNQETDDYEIYNEEELLDTSKEEVVSENEKIEANNLSKYYASEGETRNTKLGIVWIVISIIGVGIILFVLGIRGRSSKFL